MAILPIFASSKEKTELEKLIARGNTCLIKHKGFIEFIKQRSDPNESIFLIKEIGQAHLDGSEMCGMSFEDPRFMRSIIIGAYAKKHVEDGTIFINLPQDFIEHLKVIIEVNRERKKRNEECLRPYLAYMFIDFKDSSSPVASTKSCALV